MVTRSLTKKYDSEVIPGVSFTIKRATVGSRDKLEELLAENRMKRRVLIQKYETAKDDPEKLSEVADQLDAANEQRARIEIRWGLVRIDNLQVDTGDGPAVDINTAEDLLEYGDVDLALEIHKRVREHLGLTGEQAKNSESPSTSSAVEGGKTQPTIVQIAEQPVSSSAETAASISPSE